MRLRRPAARPQRPPSHGTATSRRSRTATRLRGAGAWSRPQSRHHRYEDLVRGQRPREAGSMRCRPLRGTTYPRSPNRSAQAGRDAGRGCADPATCPRFGPATSAHTRTHPWRRRGSDHRRWLRIARAAPTRFRLRRGRCRTGARDSAWRGSAHDHPCDVTVARLMRISPVARACSTSRGSPSSSASARSPSAEPAMPVMRSGHRSGPDGTSSWVESATARACISSSSSSTRRTGRRPSDSDRARVKSVSPAHRRLPRRCRGVTERANCGTPE